MCLLRGFCDLLESKNYISAAPLISLQLENIIRFSAASLVDDPDDFSLSILKGKQINHIVDSRGHRMTDRYLVNKVSEGEPRVEQLYRQTSGYIHLSAVHMYNSIQITEDEKCRMKITDQDDFVPDSLY
jgi:hypothetical protein